MALCGLGLMALTACASKPPPPMPVKLAVAIPLSVSSACERTERPVTPPPGVLDAPKPQPESDGRFSAADMASTWTALVARGRWIVTLSEFSLAQEGDVSRCDVARAGAVEIIGALTAD
jgi:hypothetical protein